MKPISFQSKASVVCSVTAAIFIDFCLKKLNVFSQHIGQKTNKYLNSAEQMPTFCVNYFLRYYLMIQHQPIVKRVNGTHEWAHRPYQLLSAPYHCCLYKHRRQDEKQPLQSSWPVHPFVPRHSVSQVTSFMQLGMLWDTPVACGTRLLHSSYCTVHIGGFQQGSWVLTLEYRPVSMANGWQLILSLVISLRMDNGDWVRYGSSANASLIVE